MANSAITTTTFGGIAAVVDDTSPHLGGNLDLNSFTIVGFTQDLDLDTNAILVPTIKTSSGVTAIDTDTNKLYDLAASQSADWNNRTLNSVNGEVASWVNDSFAVKTVGFPFHGLFDASILGADRTYILPNANGTLALTSGIPPVLTLQTNSVANGDQTLLNLTAGTNITLTDNGTGGVTIDAASGSSGISQGKFIAPKFGIT